VAIAGLRRQYHEWNAKYRFFGSDGTWSTNLGMLGRLIALNEKESCDP